LRRNKSATLLVLQPNQTEITECVARHHDIAQTPWLLNLLIACCLCLIATSCKMDSVLNSTAKLEVYKLSNTIIADSLRTEFALPSGSETIYGFYVKQPDTNRIAPHPVIIFHHGAADDLQYYWPRVELLFQAGFDVCIYDYRGFGKSTGSSSEQGLKTDAQTVLNFVRGLATTDTSFIVHYGFSIGIVNALYSAAELHQAKSVIIESGFAEGRIDAIHGEFDNEETISNIHTPVLILHGHADTIFDYTRNAVELYDAAKNPKRLIGIPNANHETIPATMGTQQYLDLITVFVRGS